MSYIPYSCQTIAEEDIDAVVAALKSDFLTQGPLVPEFETAFAKAHQVPQAIAVANATAGLHIGCLAFDVGPGSRVWTSPNSFLASANCALYCGASVDFVDIDPATRNMSVPALREKLDIARRNGTLPAVVIPVDFSGFAADLREIRTLADRYEFKILQDASHAAGATYLGRPVGSDFADATVFSFHAVKVVTTAEGGLVTTRDPVLAQRLRLLRAHGVTRDVDQLERPTEGQWYYEQQILGFNYRMTELQAALGLSQLARMRQMHEQRLMHVARYDELLKDLPLILPIRRPDRESSWHLYAVEIDETRTEVSRAEVFKCLRTANIGVNVHYIPIHTQPFYARLGFKTGDFPAAEHYYRRALSLPLFPRMTASQQAKVVEVLASAL